MLTKQWLKSLASRLAPARAARSGRAARRLRPSLEVLEARCLFSAGVNEFSTPTTGSTPYGITAGPDGNLWFTELNANKIGRITPSGTVTEFATGITAGSLPAEITAGPDGNLWFTEQIPNKIGRITPSGTVTEFATGITPGSSPYGITAGPDGNLWFTEYSGNRVGRITPSGTVTEFATGITPGSSPYGITAGPDGNLWFTEYNANKIGRITPAGTVTEFATGITPGSTPYGITAGPDGNLWFTEYSANKIGRITPSGTVTEFATGSNLLEITAGPDGNLWFTEYSANRIGRITPSGTVTEFATGITPGSHPLGITAGPDGNVWFTEYNANKIGRITVPAEFASGITPSSNPYGITAGPDGNLWFTEQSVSKIGRITPSGTVTEFATGITPGSSPYGITAGPDGNLWFTEPNGNRVGRITPSGTVTEFASGITTGSAPLGITAGPDGNLWFTETFANQIGRITPSGTVTEFATGITPSSNPRGITAGPDGNLWFTEFSGNQIGRITPAGTVTEFATGITPGSQPIGITAGPDGNLWFTEYNGNRVGRITPSGTVTEFATGITPGSSPYGITAGPDGNLWFTEANGNRVGRITPSGTVTEFATGITASGLPYGITAGPDGNLWFTEYSANKIGRITLLSGSGAPIGIAPGQTFSGVIASVIPFDPLARAGDLQALINWGDGTVTNGVLAGTGQAGFSISGTHAYTQNGTHTVTVTVTYVNAPANLNLTADTLTVKSTVTVAPAATTTTLASGSNPSPAGQPVTYLATVTTTAPGLATVSGFVQFWDSVSGFLGAATLSGGFASLTPATLAAGTHTAYAVFQGNASFATSTSASLTQQVNPAATTTTLASDFNPSPAGQPVTYLATVTTTAPGLGTVSGFVQFWDSVSGFLGAATLSGGFASLTPPTLAAGTHTAYAVFEGNASFATSTSTNLTQQVNPGPATHFLVSRSTSIRVATEFAAGITTSSLPGGITAGPDGNLWFTEFGANQIGRITPSGTVTEFATGITPGSNPYGITAGPDGNLWFTEGNANKIGRITPSGTVTEFGTGITPGSYPFGMTAGPDGNFWFTEYNGNKIGRITPSGTVTEFASGITPDSSPYGITAGPDGNLWFTEFSANQIGRITPSGTVTEFATGITPSTSPLEIAAGPDGNLWFTEANGNKIGRITPSGTVTEFATGITPGSFPSGITAGPDGNLWFTEQSIDKIGRITPSGTVTEFATGITPGSQPIAITAGPDGNLWFTEFSANKIGRIATADTTAGVGFPFTVTAVDAYNNTASGYAGTIQFSSSDGHAAFAANNVTLSSGTGSFSATLTTAGSQTLTATDTTTSTIAGTSAAITVTPAAASHFAVGAVLGITAGVAFGVSVTALDPYNNTATAYAGTVKFSTSAASFTLPPNAPLTQGAGTFPVVLFTAGNQNVTATDMASSSISGTSGNIVVNPTADPVFAVTAPATATTGSPITFTVTAHDEFNNTATLYHGTVHFSSTDPLAVFGNNNVSLTNGTGSFMATLKTAGAQSITATDASVLAITGNSAAIVTRGLLVTGVTPTPTGFTATFNEPLKLLNGSTPLVNVYDVTLTGMVTNPGFVIPGSLLFSNSSQTLTFVATNLELPDDSYSLVLTSSGSPGALHPPLAGPGVQDVNGVPLDGANNAGSADYTTTFTTSYNSVLAVSVPGFARGPGQAVNVDLVNFQNAASSAGIPVQLADNAASGTITATSVSFALSYNANWLTITNVSNVASPQGGTYSVATGGAGANATATFTYNTASALTLNPGDVLTIGQFTASVPSGAAYKSKGLLHLGGLTVQNGASAVTAAAQDGVQVVAYLGNASGLGTYAPLDASLLANFENTGALFPSFPLADPNLIAGVDGAVDPNSISQVLQFNLNKPVPGIPAYTGAPSINPAGPDPALSVERDAQSVSINIDDPHPAGSTGLMLATLALSYDPTALSISSQDIHLGTVPQAGTGWILAAPVIDPAKGQIGITIYSLTPVNTAAAGSLVTLDFHALSGAAAGKSPIQLVQAVNVGGQEIATALADSQGLLTLHQAPASNFAAGRDGEVVVSGAHSVPAPAVGRIANPAYFSSEEGRVKATDEPDGVVPEALPAPFQSGEAAVLGGWLFPGPGAEVPALMGLTYFAGVLPQWAPSNPFPARLIEQVFGEPAQRLAGPAARNSLDSLPWEAPDLGSDWLLTPNSRLQGAGEMPGPGDQSKQPPVLDPANAASAAWDLLFAQAGDDAEVE